MFHSNISNRDIFFELPDPALTIGVFFPVKIIRTLHKYLIFTTRARDNLMRPKDGPRDDLVNPRDTRYMRLQGYPWTRTKTSMFPLYPTLVLLRMPVSYVGSKPVSAHLCYITMCKVFGYQTKSFGTVWKILPVFKNVQYKLNFEPC